MIKVGSRVRYAHINKALDEETGFYPPIGTCGVVMEMDDGGVRVQWESGTKGDGLWWCDVTAVEEIPATVYDRAMEMTKEELYQLICWVYICGHRDGSKGMPDKHLDYFASQVLDQNADELFPNGNVAADLWDNYCEGR